MPDLGGQPVCAVGIELGAKRRAQGAVHLDRLTWDGTPGAVFTCPADGGTAWRKAWVNGVDHFLSSTAEPFRLIQDAGRGLLITARVQGMRRYYALLLRAGGTVELVKMRDKETVLARETLPWTFGRNYALALRVVGDLITAILDGRELFSVRDAERPLSGGGVALVCGEGRTATRRVVVSPAN